MYGSVDIINVCNLHCSHCYWWLNRKNEDQDLSADEWRQVIRRTFKKQKIFVVTLVGGEPTMRPDIIQVFCEELPKPVVDGFNLKKGNKLGMTVTDDGIHIPLAEQRENK